MCGIVGAAARRDIVPVLVEGLRRLEYRGYDSCGVAVARRATGWSALRSVAPRCRSCGADREAEALQRQTGIAHTRWATHGAPVDAQRAPASSRAARSRVVHNGIIENHEELRAELKAKGYVFETPDRHRGDRAPGAQPTTRASLFEAVRRAVKRLDGRLRDRRGVAARAASRGRRARRQPAGGRRRARARTSSPRMRSRSPAPPTGSPTSRKATSPRSACDGFRVVDAAGPRGEARSCAPCRPAATTVELGPYRHYMQKEIFEQPRAVADTLEGIEARYAGAVRRPTRSAALRERRSRC